MPNATVSQELHHYDLRSLPGGWVKLRQLSYYEMLVRRDKGSVASMEQQNTVGRGKKRNEPQSTKMILESLQTWERQYTFSNCIADHNLTDANDQPLDFSDRRIEMTLRILNPVVALEIERLIDELNGGEDDEFSEDFPNAASNYSSDETTSQLTHSE